MKLIIGLGNPGKEYANTRHNIGFMVLDNYLSNNAWQNINLSNINSKLVENVINNINNSITWQEKFNALYTTVIINNEKVIFLKPMTYMNLSGNAVRDFKNFYKIEPENILIIHDDLDLPFGKFRIKINSSAGGHNGIKSIIKELGTNSFARLKIGIGKNIKTDTKDFVLSKFNKEELTSLENKYNIFNNIINDFLTQDITKLMNDYNGG